MLTAVATRAALMLLGAAVGIISLVAVLIGQMDSSELLLVVLPMLSTSMRFFLNELFIKQ